MKNKKIIYSLIFIILFIICTNPVFPSFNSSQKEVKEYETKLIESRNHLLKYFDNFKKNISILEKEISNIENLRTKKPLKEIKKEKYTIKYFEDGVKLLIYKDSFRLYLKDYSIFKNGNFVKFDSTNFSMKRILFRKEKDYFYKYEIDSYEFWKKGNMYGFKILSDNQGILYKYYFIFENGKVVTEKVTLNDGSFLKISKTDVLRKYFKKKNQDFLISVGEYRKYSYKNGYSYSFTPDGRLRFNDTLFNSISSNEKESFFYLKEAIEDFKEAYFSEFLKIYLSGKNKKFDKTQYLTSTINFFRKKINLKGIGLNEDLNKLSSNIVNSFLKEKEQNKLKTPFLRYSLNKIKKSNLRMLLLQKNNFFEEIEYSIYNLKLRNIVLDINSENFGYYYDEKQKIGLIIFSSLKNKTQNNYIYSFPNNEMKNVPVKWYYKSKTQGFPITVFYSIERPIGLKVQLVDENNKLVNTSDDLDGYYSLKFFYLIPIDPLKRNKKYKILIQYGIKDVINKTEINFWTRE